MGLYALGWDNPNINFGFFQGSDRFDANYPDAILESIECFNPSPHHRTQEAIDRTSFLFVEGFIEYGGHESVSIGSGQASRIYGRNDNFRKSTRYQFHLG